MSGRDWFNDYMDYKLSGAENGKKTTAPEGCSVWILGAAVLVVVLRLLG